ncbi:putative exported protein [Halobacteriovorax marinus SJ]|uniref:Exported protein n=1 Tax=Halobacteriovorax marinus (strain ATCC BAA-682 / DSM 15412 / SJ) TaxID=862908 RepID=E1X435_HALMS|nr:DUF6268 family outer membrane beta-barrel protein [Halobacteriovorax marinus]CBW25375.1 putative exported protein [Halobacteriovorax marinus SJ]
MSLSKISKIVLVHFFMTSVFAAADISLDYSVPQEDDKGNEITETNFAAKYTYVLGKSDSEKSTYTLGGDLRYTELKFDEPLLGKLKLLKVKIPVGGTHVLGKNILKWTLTPGLHGQSDDFLSESEFRPEGNFIFIWPRTNLQWLLGAGFSDTFGETKIFPIFGVVWKLDEKSTLTLMFPQIKYEYLTEAKNKYNFTVAPAGAQWQWKAGQILNNSEDVDVAISGIRFSVGGDFILNDSKYLYTNIGLVTNRKFEIHRHSNTSISGEQELVNSWFFQVGARF